MGYYMGDYYRGDPGIGSFFGGLIKKVAGVATSFIPGIGPGISNVISKIGSAPAAAGMSAAAKGAIGTATSAIVKHPVLTAAGAAGALGAMGAGAAIERSMGGGGGRHARPTLKKCGMPLKHGGVGKCHRSMNVCNPRALRRAIRRTRGFAKLAMRTIHIVHPKKKGRFGGFKKRKRS